MSNKNKTNKSNKPQNKNQKTPAIAKIDRYGIFYKHGGNWTTQPYNGRAYSWSQIIELSGQPRKASEANILQGFLKLARRTIRKPVKLLKLTK
jgi:hypothetical protein